MILKIWFQESKKSPIASKRIANVIEHLTENVFLYSARGFYEQDKFLYALLLTLKIDLNRGKISFEQFNTFIKGMFNIKGTFFWLLI